MRPCSYEGCVRLVRARGMCNGHWIQWRRANPDAPTIQRGQPRVIRLNPQEVERFWAKVHKGDGCWTRGTGTKWYSKFQSSNGVLMSHRVAYELTYGPIPPNMFILHKCDNIRCVNPKHLSIGSPGDNHADMISKGRHWQASITHCPQGHEYTPENSLRTPAGGLYCRTCRNKRSLDRYYAKRRQ